MRKKQSCATSTSSLYMAQRVIAPNLPGALMTKTTLQE